MKKIIKNSIKNFLVIFFIFCFFVKFYAEEIGPGVSNNNIIINQAKEIVDLYNLKQINYMDEKHFDEYLKEAIISQKNETPLPESSLIIENIECDKRNIYTMRQNDNYERIILYIHGGAYIGRFNEIQFRFCEKLARKLNAKIYIPDYPLLPEGTCVDAYSFLIKTIDVMTKEDKIAYILGNSAGGGLALGLSEILRDYNVPIGGQILISPWVDVSMVNDDIVKLNGATAKDSLYGFKKIGLMWAKDLPVQNPMVSPIYGNLRSLPKTLLFTGSEDIMQADTLLLKNKLIKDGVNAECINKKGMFHDYVTYPITESDEAIESIYMFIK